MSVTYAENRNDDNDTREKSQLFELYFLSNLLFLPSSLLRDLAAAARNVYGQMADKTERLCIRNRNPIRLERERERVIGVCTDDLDLIWTDNGFILCPGQL